MGKKEGRAAKKVADLSEFWRGQKNIVLLDANLFACKEWERLKRSADRQRRMGGLFAGLRYSYYDAEKSGYIKRMKIKRIHFAWDRYEDKEAIIPKFKEFREITGWEKKKLGVYVLCNFNTTFEQDLERVYTLRDLGYAPYVMLYDKQNIPAGHRLGAYSVG